MRLRIPRVPLVGLALLRARGRPAPQGGTRPANAALKYWQAFGLMPALDKDQEKLLHEWDKAPLDAAALKLIDRSRKSLAYLHRGAKLDRCDWGLDYEDGVWLCSSRTWPRPGPWPAWPPCRPGTSSSGATAEAGGTTAGHPAAGPPRRGRPDHDLQLVGYAIEGMAVQAAAPLPAGLEGRPGRRGGRPGPAAGRADGRPDARAREADLLGLADPGAEGGREGQAGLLAGRVEGGVRGPGRGREPGPRSPAVRIARRGREAAGRPAPRVRRAGEADRPARGRSSTPGTRSSSRRRRAANPLAGPSCPAMDKVVAAQRRAVARLAILKAAVAVVRDGPDQLKEHQGPVRRRAVRVQATDGGFELKSKLIVQGPAGDAGGGEEVRVVARASGAA